MERIESMEAKAFQDTYPENVAHCYGCGRLNEHGLQIKSYWDGEETICHFRPRPYHTAVPGYVYGGLIASLIDCHGTGTAAAAAGRAEGRDRDGASLALRDGVSTRGLPAPHTDRRHPGTTRSGAGDQAAQSGRGGHPVG